MNETESKAADILAWACNLYCDWCDNGKPEFMSADGCAYEMVTACRHALAVLMDQPTGIMSTFPMKDAEVDEIGPDR